ncbi:maleylpyruvate isomerase family mycothiol-dependent enzyme [Dactylosporangium siamense]|uniref:Mycothiol-dependent maleylpyruvate isomerase metal-binding domain-containing protein n=1 Tax=Dactylosporangium siamense TaxID=685454 RepID=A0A919PRE4_9ACTN|nr:maleylpyruvate isomerase family mycothiol-dependent enzyme [Dactylosporangium siamense]GIG47018.1 hypothetical protein Dsi01nite_050590 [Dactylosporangium siamense]
MNDDQIWSAIHTQRAAITDLLETLSDDEWRQPSLCEGWTVRDVAAHLTLQQLGFRDALGVMRHWRGNMDRATQQAARARATTLSTGEIVAELRRTNGNRRHNLGVTQLEALIDILVHSQDIAVPLGRPFDLAPDAAAVATTRVLSMRWPPPLPSARKLAGFRLVATDVTWSAGTGPEVRAPIGALLLLVCGRLTALPGVSGDGAADLTARLTV